MHCSMFLFNPPAPTLISTLSLHDALPILGRLDPLLGRGKAGLDVAAVIFRRIADADNRRHETFAGVESDPRSEDTRLNSSHQIISYAVFCLKKKKQLRQGHGRRHYGRHPA